MGGNKRFSISRIPNGKTTPRINPRGKHNRSTQQTTQKYFWNGEDRSHIDPKLKGNLKLEVKKKKKAKLGATEPSAWNWNQNGDQNFKDWMGFGRNLSIQVWFWFLKLRNWPVLILIFLVRYLGLLTPSCSLWLGLIPFHSDWMWANTGPIFRVSFS